MLVTIFSDASFCPDTHAAGWGGWAKSERGTTRGGGPLHSPRPGGVNTAEMRAILEATRMAFVAGAAGAVALPGDTLLIQSDSQAALVALGWKSKTQTVRPHAETSAWATRFRQLLEEQSASAIFKWVKGHHPDWKNSPRHAVNHSVDREAGLHMREQRKLVR